jgi:SAM-dependent methyltransferase
MWEQWRDENRLAWDERVAIHVGPEGYDRDRFLTDHDHVSGVVAFDRQRLNGGRGLHGLDVVHLQCHLGTDTLSLLRLGAKSVTGLDFSNEALKEATWLFNQVGSPGRFVQADVFDAISALQSTYDLVYASVGAINWVNDIARWLQVAADLLRPGGSLYLRDTHPLLMSLDPDRQGGDPLSLRFDYFETIEPGTTESDHTYSGDGTMRNHKVDHEWSHSIAEIIGGALTAGFQIDGFLEDDFADWPAFPDMVENDRGEFRLPGTLPRFPFYFTLLASKPS